MQLKGNTDFYATDLYHVDDKKRPYKSKSIYLSRSDKRLKFLI